MKTVKILALILVMFFWATSVTASQQDGVVKKILIIDSYHKGYNWSTDTNSGFTSAMLELGYFDNELQVKEFNDNDYVEASRVIVKKIWMNTKRKKSKKDKIKITVKLTEIARAFSPDLIFLGDDNAARYLGNQFLDTSIPMVFWGVNNSPVKYGLVDSLEKPGHNVTGVYQSGYYVEGLSFLQTLAPKVKTFAVLADESPTGRSMVKALQHLSRKKALSVELIDTVSTSSFAEWKKGILKLQDVVDAFFIVQYNALKDEQGVYVPNTEVAAWYLDNIKIPEVAIAGQFVRQGLLCAADDAGFNQGYDAVVMADNILKRGADPAVYRPVTPKRGPLTVNRQRAEMLGIVLSDDQGIEKIIDKAQALK